MQKSFNSMNNMPMDYSELMKNMPNISMVDLNSLQNEIPKKQRIKKKKTQPEKEANEKIAKKVYDIRSIPAPHKIKESLDSYVIGQEYAKKVMSVAVYKDVYKRQLQARLLSYQSGLLRF